MVVKRIDRYLSLAFLSGFIVSLLVALGLYVSFDLLSRIEHIQKSGPLPILRHYMYFFPTVIVDALPPLLLVGAGLTLVRMSRNRELLVLKASGISVRRVAAPIFVWALAVTVLACWAKEEVIPTCARESELSERMIKNKVEDSFVLHDPDRDMRLYIESYDFALEELKNIHVMRFYPDRGVKELVAADSGTWRRDGGMNLSGVSIQRFDQSGTRTGKPEGRPTMLLETALSAYDLLRAKEEGMSVRLPSLSLKELRDKIVRNPGVPQYRVMLHVRLASPLIPFVLLLIGVPLLAGFEHSPSSRVLGIVICIAVATAFYVLSFVCVSMGNTGVVHPVVAAWLPVVTMGSAGVWMFAGMRT